MLLTLVLNPENGDNFVVNINSPKSIKTKLSMAILIEVATFLLQQLLSSQARAKMLSRKYSALTFLGAYTSLYEHKS